MRPRIAAGVPLILEISQTRSGAGFLAIAPNYAAPTRELDSPRVVSAELLGLVLVVVLIHWVHLDRCRGAWSTASCDQDWQFIKQERRHAATKRHFRKMPLKRIGCSSSRSSGRKWRNG